MGSVDGVSNSVSERNRERNRALSCLMCTHGATPPTFSSDDWAGNRLRLAARRLLALRYWPGCFYTCAAGAPPTSVVPARARTPHCPVSVLEICRQMKSISSGHFTCSTPTLFRQVSFESEAKTRRLVVALPNIFCYYTLSNSFPLYHLSPYCLSFPFVANFN